MQARTRGMQAFRKNAIWQFGASGSGEGEFDQPTSAVADSNGNIYVCEFNNDRIQKFTSAGVFVMEWGFTLYDSQTRFQPQGLCIDSADNIYATGLGTKGILLGQGHLYKFDSDGTEIAHVNQNQGFALATDNTHVYVTVTSDKLRKYDTNLSFIAEYTITTAERSGIDVDHDGNLLLSYDNNGFRVRSNTGTLLQTVTNAAVNTAANGIAEIRNNAVVVAGSDRLHEFDSDYNYIGAIGPEILGQNFSTPGLSYSNATLYCSDSGNDRIVVIADGLSQAF